MNLEMLEQNLKTILDALNNYELLASKKSSIKDKNKLKEIESKIKNISFYILKINSNLINIINQENKK